MSCGIQKLFHFLPVTYQINIRTSKFLQKFIANDNSICKIFTRQAETNLNKILSYYGSVKSIFELRSAAENMYFGNN